MMMGSGHGSHVGADLRGFAYPLQGVIQRQQWQCDRLRKAWAQCQRGTREARLQLARLQAEHQQVREGVNRQWLHRPDARLHQGFIVHLARQQTDIQRWRGEIAIRAAAQARAREAYQIQRQRLEATERHREAAISAFVQAQARAVAAEADRDWLSRAAASLLHTSRRVS